MFYPYHAHLASLPIVRSSSNELIDCSINEIQAAECEEASAPLQVAMSAGPDMFVFMLFEERGRFGLTASLRSSAMSQSRPV